jgi:hypothetical protein
LRRRSRIEVDIKDIQGILWPAKEHPMKSLAALVGVLLLLSGLFFAAQGAGYIQWPARSFMVDERNWIYYGALIALVGVVLLIASRR